MSKLKAIQRIPTDQYAYIELELEYESVEDAFIDHERLLKLHEAGVGLGTNDWAKVRNNMLITGQCDPEIIAKMNKAQRFVINQIKLALRSQTREIDTVHHSLKDQ